MTSRDRDVCTTREILIRVKKLCESDPLASDVLVNAAAKAGAWVAFFLMLGLIGMIVAFILASSNIAEAFVLGIFSALAILMSMTKWFTDKAFENELLNVAMSEAHRAHAKIAKEIIKI